MNHSKYVADWREVGVPEEKSYHLPRLTSENITISNETKYAHMKLALLRAHVDK